MSKRLPIVSFIAAIGCSALSAGAYQLGFDLWPPSATMADGTTTPFRSTDVEACLKGRTMAGLGDRSGDLYGATANVSFRNIERSTDSKSDSGW